MARSKTKNASLNKAVTAALIIAFGLLALVISYKALNQSTDDRSQAARASHVAVAHWDFNNANNHEGWTAHRVTSQQTHDGVMSIQVPTQHSQTPYMRHTGLNLMMPSGSKQLVLHAGVTPQSQANPKPHGGTFCAADVRRCSNGSYVGRVPPTCEFAECGGQTDQHYVMYMYYHIKGKHNWERPLRVEGVADGVIREHTLQIPAVSEHTIDAIQVNFSDARGKRVHFDDIQVKAQSRNAIPTRVACTQIITPARNNHTRECKSFATPCDVPEGWTPDRTCSNTTVPNVSH